MKTKKHDDLSKLIADKPKQEEQIVRQKYRKIFATIGQPHKWQDINEFISVIEDYFAECEEQSIPPTKAGILLYTRFSDWRKLNDNANRGGEWTEVIELLNSLLDKYYEEKLMSENFSGAKHWLNVCRKWVPTERQEVTSDLTFDVNDIKRQISKLESI